jgi:site-specific recombinase XerC
VLISHFTAELCRAYQYDLSAHGLAISTIRLRSDTLGSFVKWAVRRERLEKKNPLDLLTRPQRKERLPPYAEMGDGRKGPRAIVG